MKKNPKKFLSKFSMFILMGFAVVSVAMAFFPFVAQITKSDNPTVYTGFQVAFGYTVGDAGGSVLGAASKILAAPMTIAAIFLPIIAVLVCNFLFKSSKLSFFVCLGVFVAAVVLLFLTLSFATSESTVSVLGATVSESKTFAELNKDIVDLGGEKVWGLGVGAIIAICVDSLGAVLSLYNVLK